MRIILDDYGLHANPGEAFLDYYDRMGQTYFYDNLKSLTSTEDIVQSDFIDWGNDQPYVTEIGVGECAGVVIDLISTLLLEAREKVANAEETLLQGRWSDSIYHSYAGMISAAKAILLSEGLSASSYANIIEQFEAAFIATGKIDLKESFSELVYQINQNEPTEEFARAYYARAEEVYQIVSEYRAKEVTV